MRMGLRVSAGLIMTVFFVLNTTGRVVASPQGQAEGTQPGKTENTPQGSLNAKTFQGLSLRGIGPATMSGRIADIAVSPDRPDTWYIATASGGVWKTVNAGTTWTPIFDQQGSYSIGCIAVDPNRPLTIWVGTGENNSQRSVGYGDGVYKSIDGGKNWQKVGLDNSQHIGRILIDPRRSDTVFVAAQGPLWSAGGDRGLYRTEDGGKTWKKVLEISENTGVNDVVGNPRDPDILVASAYQRRRHVWTLIDGGPESAVYRSVDAGQTWTKIESGLPKVDLGRIGLAVAPSAPETMYAIVEAQEGKGGFFRSIDGGVTWEKRSDYMSSSPQYYSELVVDPSNPDRVYSMDTFLHRSDDGGKTWYSYPEKTKHVDNHALWIDPANTSHLLVGCDGGLYETSDRGETWDFTANLSITQFYHVTPDTTQPFYSVYGGTQDNATQGGPSRTLNRRGISNSDWYVTVFGDGFKTRVDPDDPNIVYSQSQYGGLVRYDKRSGEIIQIQPQPLPNEAPLRWNWSSPLIISPYSHTRLYFAAQRIFRSDDRGDSWRVISPDLSRDINRNDLEVMGRVWSVDAVAKSDSTSFYGNVVSLSESPLQEGLIYAGTDDGLVQVTEDGGGNWRRIDQIQGVPSRAYVGRVEASLHEADTVFASFDNHKQGDFKPYLLKSTDRGRNWQPIQGDLPERGSVYAFAQDHVDADLLFAGTEFGLFFTIDGGEHWVQLKGGMPVIAVRDLEIQRREQDLVVGTFGRGIYILDDYTPLRRITNEKLRSAGLLFPVRNALMYVQSRDFDTRFQGDSFFTAANPPFGAVFTYYLADEIRNLKQKRREKEKKIEKEGGNASYPSWDELRAEDRETEPAVVLTVADPDGGVVRHLTGPVTAGFHRVAWNLRYPPSNPVRLEEHEPAPWDTGPEGPMVTPGRYAVTLGQRIDGVYTQLAGPVTFEAQTLGIATLADPDKAQLLAFQVKVSRLQRAVLGAGHSVDEGLKRLQYVRKALAETPAADRQLMDQVRSLRMRLLDVQVHLTGDRTRSSRNHPTLPSITDRVEGIVDSQWRSTSAPTTTNREAYRIAAEEFVPVLKDLRRIIETDLPALEQELEKAGAPWTPGRVPRWAPE